MDSYFPLLYAFNDISITYLKKYISGKKNLGFFFISDCSSLLYSLREYYHIHYTYPHNYLKSL